MGSSLYPKKSTKIAKKSGAGVIRKKPSAVPPFNTYYPTIGHMGPAQLRFYVKLKHAIDAARPLDVQGNISYLFVYIYEMLALVDEHGYMFVRERLQQFAKFYPENEKVVGYCSSWASDCLLGLGRYEEWLEETRIQVPEAVFGTSTHFSNLRVNVALLAGRIPEPVDLVRMAGFRAKQKTRTQPQAFVNLLRDIFYERREDIERIMVTETQSTNLAAKSESGTSLVQLAFQSAYVPTLFMGAPIHQPPAPFGTIAFYTMSPLLEGIRALARLAEDRLLLKNTQSADA